MPADGARRDALFGRRFQEALVSRRRIECLERIQRGQSIGVHGSLAPLAGSIILSQTRRKLGRGQSHAETASSGQRGPDCGPPERTGRDPQRNACAVECRCGGGKRPCGRPVPVPLHGVASGGRTGCACSSVPEYASIILSLTFRKIGCRRLRTAPRLPNRGPDRDGLAFRRMVRRAWARIAP